MYTHMRARKEADGAAAEVHFTYFVYVVYTRCCAALRRPWERFFVRSLRAYIHLHSQNRLAPLHAYTVTSCVALMYKGRSVWLTCSHMLPSPSPSLLLPVLIFLFFSPCVLFHLSTSLSLSLVLIPTSYIYMCVGICVDICTPRFFLFSAFLLSLFVGQRLYPWSVHISSNQIYAPKCAHMRPWRVACGCRPRARCTFCSRGNLRLLCVARASAGTLRPFRRFATTSFSIHAVEQRWYEKNVFRK